MSGVLTNVTDECAGRGEAGMGVISVKRVRDGSWDHYYSLDHVPRSRPDLWARYQAHFVRDVAERVRVAVREGVAVRIWVETPGHPNPDRRARRRFMPSALLRITNDDGTEATYGPVEVSKKLAGQLAEPLEPLEAKRQETLTKDRVAEIEADQAKRSRQAEEHNQRRMERAARGLDPDKGDD